MKKIRSIGIAIGFAAVAAATFPYKDEDGARETLAKTTGFTDVRISEGRDNWLLSSCGKGDLFRTKFSAVNDKGDTVNGTVCKGLFKGSTVRFD